MGQAASTEAQDANPNNPEVAWWCKLLAKVCGAIAGIVAIITGIWTIISVTPLCIIAGILMIILGFVVLMFEVPICCTFLDVTQPVARFSENRTYFQKALIFGISAILPVALCFGIASLMGCILVFATGVIYGLMALGRKADREQMSQQAGRQPVPQSNMEAGAYDDTGRDNLIDGNQPQQQNPFGAQKQPASVY